MSEAWVYRHADELGVERRGSGPKARLRFDLERARVAFVQATPQAQTPPPTRRTRRASSRSLLPVKDRAA